MSKYGVISGPYFVVFGLNKEIYGRKSPYSVRIHKIRNIKSSVLETFHVVGVYLLSILDFLKTRSVFLFAFDFQRHICCFQNSDPVKSFLAIKYLICACFLTAVGFIFTIENKIFPSGTSVSLHWKILWFKLCPYYVVIEKWTKKFVAYL